MKILVATLVFSAAAFAQTVAGTVRGRIVDPNGAAAPEARLTFRLSLTSQCFLCFLDLLWRIPVQRSLARFAS